MRWRSVLLLLLVAATTPVAAQELITRTSRADLRETLEAIGLQVSTRQESEDGWIVAIGPTSTGFWVQDGGRTIKALAFLNDARADAEAINRFNASKRFARAYLDTEGDLFLQLDVDLARGVTEANLQQHLRLFLRILTDAKEAF